MLSLFSLSIHFTFLIMGGVKNFGSDDNFLQDLNLDDLENDSELSFDSNDFLEKPLCVPQDPIEDLEWYPNFNDSLISSLELELNDPKNEFQFHDTPKEQKFDTTKNPPVIKPGKPKNSSGIVLEQLNIESKMPQEFPLQNKGFERLNCGFAKKPRTKRTYHYGKSKSLMGSKNIEISRHFVVAKRRCKHCEIKMTPQWRSGPLGPKTLCNACGMRYKSGRLVPEYRPVASPTFDKRKHSNFHAKVLKKRAL